MLMRFISHFYRNGMIETIDCTLDMYDWIMEEADSLVPRCQNESESYSTLKASHCANINTNNFIYLTARFSNY